MLAYAFRRFLLAVSLVWGVSFGAFVAFGLSFDPTYGYNLCTSASCVEKHEELIAQYHLHEPILQRYWIWLSGLFQHGFGTTVVGMFRFDGTQQIDPVVFGAAEVTLELLASALVLVVVFSVLVGAVSARWPGTPLDGLLRLFAYLAWSLPTVVLAALLARWLGPSGWFFFGTPGGGFVPWIRTMALPAVTLALGLVGLYSRYVRSSLAVELRQPYAVVARAKGLPEGRVLLRHTLRNSLIPFSSALALEIGAVVGASLAADYVFGMGGLAEAFLFSLNQADPFAMTAILVVIAGLVAAFMFAIDLVVGWLDPRARIAALA